MDNYIARANIDRYLELLGNDDVPSTKRSMVIKLLIEEENKLSHDLAQLEFAESKAVLCRDRVNKLKVLRDGFVDGSDDHMQADRLLMNFEALLTQVESFCGHMRRRVNSSAL